MKQANDLDSLQRVYGSGIHLYYQGVMYEGWFLVPIDWGKSSYTVCCFDPRGNEYLEWNHHSSIEKALQAGQELANQIISRVATDARNSKFRTILPRSSGRPDYQEL
jgi:hypothetical protein